MSTKPTTGTISETGTINLPPAVTDRVSSYLIHFQSSSFSGSVTIKGAVIDRNYTAQAVAYKNMSTGLNATAAITGDALILVDAAGLSIALDATVASGSLAFSAVPLVG